MQPTQKLTIFFKYFIEMKIDANLNRHALRPNKQYWNIFPKKDKIQIFDRKPQPNIYKWNMNQR